jgi:hypothetical protein
MSPDPITAPHAIGSEKPLSSPQGLFSFWGIPIA